MRTFIIVAACLLSSGAFTQESSQGTAPIPDFSGTWGHPYLPGFEPPPSGPGPVLNKARLPTGQSAFDLLVGDYTNPILQPQSAEVVKSRGEMELTGALAPTPYNQCWPQPVPYIFWSVGMRLLQKPDKITILYHSDHEYRQARLNQPHPTHVTPSWYGDSVGHYEGDTLVIDTVAVKAARPLAMVDVYGTPYTGALHVVERYQLLDYEATKEAQVRAEKEYLRPSGAAGGWAPDPNYQGKGLQLQFTVDDPGAFTMPWSATITYRRPLAAEWPEQVCAENPHDYATGKDTPVPHADKPDF